MEHTVTVELTAEQYAFLTTLQKTHEQELGIEVPISALVRKAVEGAMKSQARHEEKREGRPERAPRPGGRSFDKPGFKSGPRKPFGAPAGRGPKFDMLGARNKTRTFDK